MRAEGQCGLGGPRSAKPRGPEPDLYLNCCYSYYNYHCHINTIYINIIGINTTIYYYFLC